MTKIFQTDDTTAFEHRTIVFAEAEVDGSRHSPQDERVYCLVVVEGPETRHIIRVDTVPLVIGRSPESDFVLDDSELSRRHCSVQRVGDEVLVTDLNSTNGTFIEGKRISGATTLSVGAALRIGRQLLQLDRRRISEVEQVQALDRDLARASAYVQALLPAPVTEGRIRTEWLFVPSARLGGDAFGYDAIDENSFFGYVIDVSGHGAGAAVHSVSVMNILRNKAVPGADLRDPAAVLKKLNSMFPMAEHGGMFFTMWYGVFDATTRTLGFCSAGHHPGFLVPPGRGEAIPLRTPNPAVGVASVDALFKTERVHVPPGSMLYLFSDGLFEVATTQGRQWRLADLVQLILQPMAPGMGEVQRLYAAVRSLLGRGSFDDDVSLVVIRFD